VTDPVDDDPFFTSSPGAAPAPKPAPTRERPLRPSAGRFVFGWFVMPVAVIAGLILAGIHFGARNSDAWYSNIVRWLASLE